MRRGIIAAAVAGVACMLAVPQARAGEEITIRQAHPWGFGASFSWLATGVPVFASVGASVDRAFGRWFGVEAGLENGIASTAADLAATRLDPKLLGRLSARGMLPLDAQERAALFLSAGPEVLVGNAYDRLPLAHVEAGFTLRTWSGLALLGAGVANFALAQRGPAVAPADCLSTCDGPINYGTRSIGFRVGLGAAF